MSKPVSATVLNAVMANTTTKIVFAMRDPDDAAYLARVLFSGFIDYAEYKPGTERPVVIGHERAIVNSHSRATHTAEHQSIGLSRSRAVGMAQSQMQSWSEGASETVAEGDTLGQTSSVSDAIGGGSSRSSFEAEGASVSMLPLPEPTFLQPNPEPIFTGMGVNISSGANTGENASWSSAHATSQSQSSSRSRAYSTTQARTQGLSTSESHVHSVAHSHARGHMQGQSQATGESETFVAKIEWLPSQLYNSQEQFERLVGELINARHRECFVKVADARPIRTRTADLAPSFRSFYAKRVFVAHYRAHYVRTSGYLHSTAEADRAIEATLRALKISTVGDVSLDPEPVPILDDPELFAQEFHRRRGKPKKPPTKPRIIIDNDPGSAS